MIEEFLNKSPKGRLIALDVGTKTIGLAVTDDARRISLPLDTILRKGNQKDIPELLKIFNEKKITGVVVGLPLSFSGEETESSIFVRRFVTNLSLQTELPMVFQDERLSSFVAEDFMMDKMGSGSGKTKKVVDRVAASYILNDFLNLQ